MNKKYIVRLNDQERRELVTVIAKLKGTSWRGIAATKKVIEFDM